MIVLPTGLAVMSCEQRDDATSHRAARRAHLEYAVETRDRTVLTAG